VREPFESFKLLGGIAKACEKTEVSEAMVTAIAQSIETEIQRRTHREIASTEIGNLVLEALQPLSEVAYVRFASVYHQFKTAQDFAATLDHLNHEGNVALGHNVELGEEEHSPGFDRRSPASALPG
jgi:transcriptional repressor NrdR